MTESENYYSEAEVQELIKELEQSIEDRENLQSENSELFSEVSTLKSELQKRSQKIVSLNEEIEKLSNSDLELKQAEKLLSDSEQNRRESERKLQKAEDMVRASSCRLQEAEEKNEKAEEHIRARVEKKAEQIKRENAQKLREETERAKAIYSYPTYALGAFSLVTVFYAIDMWHVLKTVPQWFVNRWENIKTIAGAVRTAYLWMHDFVPASWTEIARHAIPIIIFGLIAYFGFYKGLHKGLICRFKAWNKKKWEDYARHDETRQKYAFTAFWCAFSLLLSVCICDVWKKCPLNVLSIYLILSIACYVLYHTRERKASYGHY